MRIKGFDGDLKCRGFQFEIGETYDTGANDNNLSLCSNSVFHYCKSLQQVHDFYNVNDTNRFCEIEVLGAEISDDEKCGSNKIKILQEIVGEELNVLCGRINGNTGLFNTGDMNTGDRNTGYRNTGDMNTGDMNTGDRNTGDRNTGYRNTGYRNTGDRNTGYRNTGDMNTGDMNTGDRNTGDRNTGYMNTGDRNTGMFNSCNGSNGIFCTKEPDIDIFNMPSGMTLKEFYNSRYYDAFWSAPFNLTEVIGNQFVSHTYQEACAVWWDNMTENNKDIIKSMPNFNPRIFEEITGIKI